MKATLKINDKEIEVDITEEELKKLEEKKPNRKRWRAEEGKKYWCVSTFGVDWTHEEKPDEQGNVVDSFLYSTGNYFKAQEEAEFYKNELIYTQMLKDYIYEHDDGELDWNDILQDKCYLAYDFMNEKIDCYSSSCQTKWQGTIYASNEQVLKDAVKFIGEENVKKYILKVEE